MWRGEPPDSPWYGGSGGDKYLAMDLVQPQVGQQQKVPKTINPQELLQVPTTQVLMARRCAPFVLVRRHQRRQAPRHGPSAVTGAAQGTCKVSTHWETRGLWTPAAGGWQARPWSGAMPGVEHQAIVLHPVVTEAKPEPLLCRCRTIATGWCLVTGTSGREIWRLTTWPLWSFSSVRYGTAGIWRSHSTAPSSCPRYGRHDSVLDISQKTQQRCASCWLESGARFRAHLHPAQGAGHPLGRPSSASEPSQTYLQLHHRTCAPLPPAQMACFCDHNWVRPWQCRSPPAWVTNTGPRKEDFDLPYACPLDFIFEPVHMLEGDECAPSLVDAPQAQTSQNGCCFQIALWTSASPHARGDQCAFVPSKGTVRRISQLSTQSAGLPGASLCTCWIAAGAPACLNAQGDEYGRLAKWLASCTDMS